METARTPYEILILVCTNRREGSRRSCGVSGSEAIHAALKRAVKEAALPVLVRVSQSGCLDLCEKGPVVLIYPSGRLFIGVTESDIPSILAAFPFE